MKRESSMFNEPPATTARRWFNSNRRDSRPPRRFPYKFAATLTVLYCAFAQGSRCAARKRQGRSRRASEPALNRGGKMKKKGLLQPGPSATTGQDGSKYKEENFYCNAHYRENDRANAQSKILISLFATPTLRRKSRSAPVEPATYRPVSPASGPKGVLRG